MVASKPVARDDGCSPIHCFVCKISVEVWAVSTVKDPVSKRIPNVFLQEQMVERWKTYETYICIDIYKQKCLLVLKNFNSPLLH